MQPDRSHPFQEQDGAGRRHVPAAAIAFLQEDADRARLRRQAQRAGLYGLLGQADRRLAEKLDLIGADHAVGNWRHGDPEVRRVHRIGMGFSPCSGFWSDRAGAHPRCLPRMRVAESNQMDEFLRRGFILVAAVGLPLFRHGATNPCGMRLLPSEIIDIGGAVAHHD